MPYVCHTCPTDGTQAELTAHHQATGHPISPWRRGDPETNRVIEARPWGWADITRVPERCPYCGQRGNGEPCDPYCGADTTEEAGA
jgi:hypothetical protein